MNKIDLLDGSYLCYDRGQFDKWCVYKIDENGLSEAPKDIDYFNDLYKYAKIFGNVKIYNDFVIIYDMTTNIFESNVVEDIKNLSSEYGKFSDEIFRIFSTLYMVMISEQNKKNTKLGKRIKRLGVYFLLVKKEKPEYCANFMRGKPWRELVKLCLEGGF